MTYKSKGFIRSLNSNYAQIAQSVEQWTENPRVAGSIPALGIFFSLQTFVNRVFGVFLFL